MIARHIEWGRRFAGWIEQADEFELVAPPAFALCVFRLRTLDGDTEGADRALCRLFDSLQGTRRLYLTRRGYRRPAGYSFQHRCTYDMLGRYYG